MKDMIGWASACVLLATLIGQTAHEMRDRSAHGISPWLFIGQSAASVGFIVYSWLLHSWVFLVTNSLILLTALVGEALYLRNRRHGR